MHHDTACFDSAIMTGFSTIDNNHQYYFQLLTVLIAFVNVDFHLVDCILNLVSRTKYMYHLGT